ncbi:hypothetical protein QLQ15_13905 [Lysobacter sp. LF1]|uniref:Metal-dependent HD superfamily phosphohydrolase n=1 Tax=Lysobacter stagni TaxID=3045172 RepID=A0ABT6XJ73_9GAMM|nr:hypothetical protein [Lysobacter sp. LF1]MDI9240003.1 hypothetical protein [Lysobacter sp. LF1]
MSDTAALASCLPFSPPDAQISALQEAYASPPRAYHNIAHVQEVLRHYRDAANGPGWRQPVEVALAVLYHDAIYEAGRKDNETRSAEMAVAQIARWMPDAGVDVRRVMDLIELTARHGSFSPGDVDEEAALFLDCDMAILGAPPEVFDAYDRGIAAEYRGHVPGWLFKLNRRRFLKALLGRPRIYLSGYFHERYDAQARRNLRRAVTEKR